MGILDTGVYDTHGFYGLRTSDFASKSDLLFGLLDTTTSRKIENSARCLFDPYT